MVAQPPPRVLNYCVAAPQRINETEQYLRHSNAFLDQLQNIKKAANNKYIDGVTLAKGAAVTRGQTIGTVRAGSPSFLHFEVRQGIDSVDPMPYLQ